ncbi:protein of unknown function [Loktanella atrilutea]|uniref:DUF4396 domain-containing protein n=1 Tax=Loktanella atrilutea TaxID=366533 RepID=A0A1M4YBK7_LOKAT|nr:DUF4396 domain-containing protein [Loktanella atrilutea]SHF03120.1 protein of unknown function [Loktanella atrilutea]
MDSIRTFLDSPAFLIGWACLMIPSVAILWWDLRRQPIMSLMKAVWTLTVIYSGPLGLLIYWLTGRRQIADDRLWRRGFRSVAHCYSGCGAGEIVGVLIAVGLFAAGNGWTAAVTFTFAYLFGLALTIGPLMQDGVDFSQALKDALISETPSIAVMEVVAIGVDLWLAGQATMGDVRFWTSMIVSLTCGLLAAYPVNLVLLRFGVKEGMMDPRKA